jgi:hypothetical protein
LGRASQYSATIDCEGCQRQFVVHYDPRHKLPSVVRRENFEAIEAARAKRRAAEERVKKSEEARRLTPRIISAIDTQPTMAAKHRVLERFGLANHSLRVYRTRPYGGEEAIRLGGGRALARIGSMPDMGGADLGYFVRAAEEIAALAHAEKSIKLHPVKTNAQLMQF